VGSARHAIGDILARPRAVARLPRRRIRRSSPLDHPCGDVGAWRLDVRDGAFALAVNDPPSLITALSFSRRCRTVMSAILVPDNDVSEHAGCDDTDLAVESIVLAFNWCRHESPPSS
jgi:hypothetical protein